MRQNFAKAMSVELAFEGGYSNHPRDPGGVTLEGIIQRVYDAYRRRKGLPLQPLIASMRGTPQWIAERDDIYRTQYANPIRFDELPAGVDIVVLDGAVNSGPYQAGLWLQRALGINDPDGHIGEGTLMAVMSHPDHDALIADLLARRLGMLQHLSTWDAFGVGWGRRVSSVKAIGQALAMGSVGPNPVAAHVDGGMAKAYASDVSQPPVSESVGQNTAYGNAGLAALLQTAKETVQPYVGTSDFITKVYVSLTVAAVIGAAGAAGYAFWASRKNKQAQRAINGEVVAPVDDLDAALNGARA